MKLHGVLMLVVCLAFVSAAEAQRHQLRVGNSAPALTIESWVKGQPISIQEDNVYVIEFWATWCGPCRAAIPKLTELQEHYGSDGLHIIGVSTEDEADVRRFVEAQGDRIGFTIAVDNNRSTERAWHTAAGREGIPSAFIVDRRGNIQFIGNPHSAEFTQVLSMVMDGRFDARLFREAEPMLNAAENARKMRNWRQAFNLYDQVIEVDSFIFAPLELTKFEIMIVDMEDPERAYAHARRVMSTYGEDSALMLTLSRTITTDARIPNDKRDLELAMEAVELAKRHSSDRNHPRLLASEALVHFHKGEIDRAVSLQRRAWMIAAPARKPEYERVLRNYQDASNRGATRSGGSSRSGSSFR